MKFGQFIFMKRTGHNCINRLKKSLRSLTGRNLLLLVGAAVSCVAALILGAAGSSMTAKLADQSFAMRWSDKKDVAQISCFFSVDSGITQDSLIGFEHMLDSALLQASITVPAETPGARLWVDAYSANGRITIESSRASIELPAVGVGGDFFLFHPLKLLSGSYFSGSDLMQDFIIIDEDAAWQLFGSNDVAGQLVMVAGVPHIIAGVVHREDGRLAKKAGLRESVAYVSYSTLDSCGINYGLNTYELLMPNPVSGYALQYVQEHIGVSEQNVEVVENSERYSLLSRFKVLAGFGTRSMNGKAIIYPYWENLARGYEDIAALLLLLTLLCWLFPAILAIIWLIRAWRHKSWTAKTVWRALMEQKDSLAEKMRKKRNSKKKNKEEEAL